MEQPLHAELIRRLSQWPNIQATINMTKTNEEKLDGVEEQREHDDSQTEEVKQCEVEEEENPALEGHFLTEGSVMEVVLADTCQCCCHQEQLEGFELSMPFSCSKCSQQFCCKCQFISHRELHRAERKYSCQVCGKSYLYKSDLARHRPVHSDVKPHVCKVCGRSFNQVGHLITHRLIHTGEKPFQCDVCNKPFNRKSNLQKHKMIHTGERPFLCLVCGARFGRKGDLQRHTMLHTGERPYKCEICDKSFSQKPHLLSHQSVHTGERPYKCPDCNKSFNRKSNLLKHQVSKCPAKNGDFGDLGTIASSFFSLGSLIVSKTVADYSDEEMKPDATLAGNTLLIDASNNNLPDQSANLEPNDLSVLRARLSSPKISFDSSSGDVSSFAKKIVRSRLESALLQSGQRLQDSPPSRETISDETETNEVSDSGPEQNPVERKLRPQSICGDSVLEQGGDLSENSRSSSS